MKLLLVFVLLPLCCHGFRDQAYDPVKVNALKGRARRSVGTENGLSNSSGNETNKRRINPLMSMLRSYYKSEIESIRLMSNGEGEENDTHKEEGEGVSAAGFRWEPVKTPMIYCIFIMVVSICKLGFHHAHFLSSIIPESCLLIVLGIACGGLIKAGGHATPCLIMTPDLFFYYLLPPIILDAAHALYDRTFLDNLSTILLHAIFGTLLNCFIIGPVLCGLSEGQVMGNVTLKMKEALVFSSLIAAVDPVAVLAIFQEIGVNDVLYFVVFGESLLNDAVTVVLYEMMQAFYVIEHVEAKEGLVGFASFFTVSLGGLSIGIIFGLFTAFVTKYTKQVRVVEALAILVLGYTAYLTAQMVEWSGIISITGCGLVQAHYAFHNIGYKSEITVRYFTKMVSGCSDSIIFLYLGLAMIPSCTGAGEHVWKGWFILWVIVLCVVVRFIVVFSLNFFANKARLRKLNLEEQFIMAYGGLRGAVAFSLVNTMDGEAFKEHKDMFQTTTLMVILFTVFVQGITVKPLVKLLRITRSEKDEPTMIQEIHNHVTDHMMSGVEEIVGSKGQNAVRSWMGNFDNRYIKRWLQRDPHTKNEIILEAYQDIEMSAYYQHLEEKAVGGPCDDNVFYPSDPIHPGLTDVVIDLQYPPSRSRAPTGLSVMTRSRRVSEVSATSGASVGRLHSLFAKMLRQISTTEHEPSEPGTTAQDLREMLRRRENFHQRYDRNMIYQDQTDLWHRLQENETRRSRFNTQYTYPYPYETTQDMTHTGMVRRRTLLTRHTSHASEVSTIAKRMSMAPMRPRALTEPTGVGAEPNVRRRNHLDSIRDEDEDQSDRHSNSTASNGTDETKL